MKADAVSTARPWPLLVLTALGAWFVALPLLGFVALLAGPAFENGPAMALIGALLLLPAVLLLRRPQLPLFAEQLAIPLLLAGALQLGWGLNQTLSSGQGERHLAWLLGALAMGLAALLPRPGLRTLLGLGLGLAWVAQALVWRWFEPGAVAPALALTLLWGLGLQFLPPRLQPLWASTGGGAQLPLLLALALASGSPWLAAGLMPFGAWQGASGSATALGLLALLSALALLAWRQPLLRGRAALGLAGLATAATALLPALGPVALVAAIAWQFAQPRLALAAAVAALWVLGSFYYALQWPLLHKAGLLAAMAAALGLWALVHRAPRQLQVEAALTSTAWAARGLLLAGVLTLAVLNTGIWRKQQLIAHGQPLFVALAPVDPRSLMQGDYMALRFALPEDLRHWPHLQGAERPLLRVQVDAQARALHWRADDATPLAPNERRVELSPKAGRWMLVSDAWFFAEGEAARWQAARWGEFRVQADGRALLVGLRGEQLQPL